MILISGLVSWDDLGTLRGRGAMLEGVLVLFQTYPLDLVTGGYSEQFLAAAFYSGGQNVHNLALYIVAQFGVVATVLWFFLVILELRRLFEAGTVKDRELKPLGVALSGGLVATVFLYAQTTPFADQVQALLWLFFWLGLGVSLSKFFIASTTPDGTYVRRQSSVQATSARRGATRASTSG